jgi:hypothetical protein
MPCSHRLESSPPRKSASGDGVYGLRTPLSVLE